MRGSKEVGQLWKYWESSAFWGATLGNVNKKKHELSVLGQGNTGKKENAPEKWKKQHPHQYNGIQRTLWGLWSSKEKNTKKKRRMRKREIDGTYMVPRGFRKQGCRGWVWGTRTRENGNSTKSGHLTKKTSVAGCEKKKGAQPKTTCDSLASDQVRQSGKKAKRRKEKGITTAHIVGVRGMKRFTKQKPWGR